MKDRFGVSWQVVPDELEKLLADPDQGRAQRAMAAMLQMQQDRHRRRARGRRRRLTARPVALGPDQDNGPATGFHMTPDELRRHGHEMVDWVADYLERVGDLPVLSQSAPGSVRAALPAAPAGARGGRSRRCSPTSTGWCCPGVTHWQSPSFFAYFPANSSGPAVLGDLVSAGLGVQGMLWATSPGGTELETHVLDWLVELLGLPDALPLRAAGGGVIQDSASSASLVALLAARERATAGAANRSGVRPGLVAYASSQAHSSIEKAARIAGLGSESLPRRRRRRPHPRHGPGRPRPDDRRGRRRRAHTRSSSRPRSAPPARPRWTRCARSARSAAGTAPGCTSTRR